MITKQDCLTLGKHIGGEYSQNGEAGVLARLVELVGSPTKVSVEFGCGDGWNLSNTRQFAKLGWRAVMIDVAHEGSDVFKRRLTVDNINSVFEELEVPREFDLLSIDVDGNDYWLWEALAFKARIVIIEFNGAVPPGVRKTVPYDPDFWHDGTDYYGASFEALVTLGKRLGYVPVFQMLSLNLFFVRADLLKGPAPVVNYRESHYHTPDSKGRQWVTV